MKEFGTKKSGIIFLIDEEKLNLDIIGQIRNYLTLQEKRIRKNKTIKP